MTSRQGYEFFFPSLEYVEALRVLKNKSHFGRISMDTGIKYGLLGVKLRRMIEHGLIEKDKKGFGATYSITPFGSKVLKAYDAYADVMRDD